MDEDTRTLTEDDKIYDLVDVIDENPDGVLPADTLDDEIASVVSKIAERSAREMFPSIAEKIIREEIDRLKESPGK
ncbi:MAG: hypothetical protein JRD89_05540 [Deltaproteobacteria bacterium]|nr:hypothetical protein [Deltaproteobacteria bacterium]